MQRNSIEMAQKKETSVPVRLELSREEVNRVLEALSKQPFIDVYKLIEKIHVQAKNNESKK
jgi:hypothetical protein